MGKVTVARALTSRIARRFLRLADIVVLATAALLIAGIWALAYFFSGWWWLLLLPFLFAAGVYVIVRFVVAIIVSRIHVGKLTAEQRKALDDFTGKVQQVLEARATPLPIIAIICIKDILFHRDVTTIKKIISETVGLRRDYQALARLFS